MAATSRRAETRRQVLLTQTQRNTKAYFGGDEHVFTRHCTGCNGAADAGFVLVPLRRVDVAVSDTQRRGDGGFRFFVGHEIGAEADSGDGQGPPQPRRAVRRHC